MGRHWYNWFKERDADVYGIDNMSAGHVTADTVDEGADARTIFQDAKYLATFDRIYHFAAPVGGRTKIEGDPLFNAESLEIDSALFRAVGSLGENAPLILYPSSSAVYPTIHQGLDSVRLDEPLFDPSLPVYGRPDEMYGFTKMAGEVLAYNAAKYGVNTLCIRPFSGYGPGQPPDYPMTSIIRRALKREDPIHVWGPGTQTRDFIHVQDMIRITERRIRAGIEGYQTLNLGSGKATSFIELASIVADLQGYLPQVVALPDKPFGVFNRVANVTAMSEYGVPYVSLEEGVQTVIDYEKGLDKYPTT